MMVVADNEPPGMPPANGFTKGIRRIVAVACALFFFGYLVAFALDLVKREWPGWILAMQFAGALMYFDGINEFLKRFGGPK